MKEYIVDWNPANIDLLNDQVREKLKDAYCDIRFETVERKLSVGTPHGTIEIDGQSQVKIIVDDSSKQYFKWTLRRGEIINDKFPKYLQNYIETEFNFPVY